VKTLPNMANIMAHIFRNAQCVTIP